ncbi:MAG: zinc ABC transporter permease, partial [Algoriphagus sp.]|nr:zinc ABC transporter permease [Algoriphagus sp.]
KALYKAKDENKNGLTIDEIYELYPYQKAQIDQSIKDLLKEGFIAKNQSLVNLTPQGISDAMRIVRLHRLWELYLNEYMNIAPDHVHESAEQMEHLLTPELEAMLEKRLNFPTLDPHQETIPRENHDL